MYRLVALLFLLCLASSGWAQEICDNGYDDDGNGLIDLQDPACECTGIFQVTNQTDRIPNPSFEDMECCPSTFGDLPCTAGWESANAATPDFNHTCGWMVPAIPNYSLLPFPDGNGVAGMVFYGWHQEIIKACLNAPLQPYTDYKLTFFVAGMPINNDGTMCNGGMNYFTSTSMTLYGSAACNIPAPGVGCPTLGNPAWVELGTVDVVPGQGWVKVSIEFTPTIQIVDLALGTPCNPPPEYNTGNPCLAYFLVDGLDLEGEEKVDEITITPLGSPCTYGYALDAFVEHFGGSYQWYYEGVAIFGQTDPYFELAANNYQSGTYQIVYSTGAGCVSDSIEVYIPPFPDTLVSQHLVCPDEIVECGGQMLTAPGTYDMILQTAQGCDSMVTCVVEHYDLVPTTELTIDTCGPATITVCGQQVNQSGFYTFICDDKRGCDSIITLELQILAPEVRFDTVATLDCDTASFVILDATPSTADEPNNGYTEFRWTGPPGGIPGDKDGIQAKVVLPGKYCLEIKMVAGNQICRDTGCVIVSLDDALLPSPPLLNGPTSACTGDSMLIALSDTSAVKALGYQWILPSGKPLTLLNDSTLLFFPEESATDSICAILLGECGPSDTTCLVVSTGPRDRTELFTDTCEPSEAGVFQSDLTNIFGCDSIVVHTVTLRPSDLLLIPGSTCNPAQAGTDTLFLVNRYGCDSLIIRETVLRPTDTLRIDLYTCDPAQAASDTFHLTNQFGCDSTVYYRVLYVGVYQETTEKFECGSSPSYADTLLVQTGPCDSLFITKYIFTAPDTTYLKSSSCDPAQAGVFSTLLQGQAGCDSLVIREVSLLPSDTTYAQKFTCAQGGAGIQQFLLKNKYGCDSLHILTTVYAGVDTVFLQGQTCDPAKAGLSVQIAPGPYCDTVKVTNTALVNVLVTRDSIVQCGEQPMRSDTLFLVGSSGCDSLAITVTRFVLPTTGAEVLGESCLGDGDGEIRVTASGEVLQPVEYRLLPNGGWQSGNTFAGLDPGNYGIEVRDARGCRDTVSGLSVQPGIVLVLDAGADVSVEFGTEVPLRVTANHTLQSVLWQAPTPVACPTCPVTRTAPMEEAATLLVSGVTENGCRGEDSLRIRVIERALVYIPGSFSPNYDGINDIFTPFGNRFVKGIRNLAVYDRWGNSLYLQTDLPINDPSAGWDGHYRGKRMDPGVYIYVTEVEMTDGSIRLFKGDVTLTY